jgi:Terminase large subunit, T4likevirus-type, N-terminal
MKDELLRELALVLDPSRILAWAGRTPDPWQVGFLRGRPARALLCCARQVGKSTTVAAAAVYEALYEPGAVVLMVAPAQRQSEELLRKARELVLGLPPTMQAVHTSRTALTFANGSRIIALPGTAATIRGFSAVSLLLVDEAAHADLNDLLVALQPMLAVSGGRLVALSTPNGRRGWFFQAWESKEEWQRIRIAASDCPRIPEEFLAEQQRQMTRAAFASEYLCEFVDAVDAVYAEADIAAALDPTLTPLFAQGW